MREAVFYSIDDTLTATSHEAVRFDRAKEIFDQYYSRLQPQYQSGESALSQTMFGFSRSEDEFIELCLHDHHSISCKVCLPPPPGSGIRRLFARSLDWDETLSSRDAVLERLRQFFTLSPAEFRDLLRRR